jgi:non-heme chloroperoxidase
MDTTGRARRYPREFARILAPGHAVFDQSAYDCIKAFSETDFTDDLKRIDVPTLILHGDDDQIVPIGSSALMSAKLVKQASLKTYPGLSHGTCTINADLINKDLLTFANG